MDYKFKRTDFGEMPVTLEHLHIYLNFLDGYVESDITLDITAKVKLTKVELDAKELDILSVEWAHGPESGPARYTYEKERCKLALQPIAPIPAGTKFGVRARSKCRPSDNLLEGIYCDVTPPGAPQQYMSQCQQWGFQRIMPIFDDCRAKCTMTTTMEADAAYTHLISNGNISRTTNPEGKPIPKPGAPGRVVITYENPTAMAPYLFIAAVGTWDVLADEVTYDSGRKVRLEYLTPPGRTVHAKIPMEILKQSALWIKETQGYEYTGDTYRTICMTKSNFGGMENVGNTTIVTDAALIDEHTLDHSLFYAHAVIVHEFEHNQCGSETTMETPFDVWLNEAYTVDVERAFMASLFDPTYVRLGQIDGIRSPLAGPLAIEDGGGAGTIVREGFNDPDDLIDAVTYVKAAEVIRMLRLVLGAEAFNKGRNLYFERYRGMNANTDQFFACFEKVSGVELEDFRRAWLYRVGYPTVTAAASYDEAAREYRIEFTQQVPADGTPYYAPIQAALVDKAGREIPDTAVTFHFKKERDTLRFPNITSAPAFASVNRDYSFYGAFKLDADPETLAAQALLDTNHFNRVEAFRRLTDRERIGLMTDENHKIGRHWLETYGRLLAESAPAPGLKAYFLRIDEQPVDRAYATWFPQLVCAKETLMRAVNKAFRPELLQLYSSLDTRRVPESPRDGIEERALKATALDLLSSDDSEESHALILAHYRNAVTAQDRTAALVMLNRSTCLERRDILRSVYNEWRGHLSAYANYLRIIGAGRVEDVFDMVEEELNRPDFDITQPTCVRALFLSLASNNKVVWTDQGIGWVRDKVVSLTRVNPYVAGRLLNTFQHYRNLRPELKDKVRPALEHIIDAVPVELSQSVNGQARAYLA